MFLFECKKEERNRIRTPLNLSIITHLNHVEIDDDNCLFNIHLYGNDYHRGSALFKHEDELFALTRKCFQVLDNLGKTSRTSFGSLDLENDIPMLRGQTVLFFSFVLEQLNLCLSDKIRAPACDTNRYLQKLSMFIASFRKLIRSVKDLPDFVVHNSSSAQGNECPLASYHLFHLHLEMSWFLLLIRQKIILVEQHMKPVLEDFPDVADERISKTDEIKSELQWLIYNLTALSVSRYHSMSTQNEHADKDLFICDCVKELWIATQHFCESLPDGQCFWSYYNEILNKFILTKDIKESINGLHFATIPCENIGAFALWQLYDVAFLCGYDKDGNYNSQSQKITANYDLLEKCMKTLFMNPNASITELQLRRCLKQIIELTGMWWESRNDTLNILWEYFHKRLNSAFSAATIKDNVIGFSEQSITQIARKLHRFTDGDKISTATESSFCMFLHLLGFYLKKHHDLQQTSQCQKIKGRIYPKFTQNKLNSLTEIGLQNFTMIYITMALATDITDVCQKLHNLLIQIPFEGVSLNQKTTLIKAHLLICYFYIEYGVSISGIAKPILSDITNISNQRDSDSIYLLKSFADGVIDIISSSQTYQQDEHVLIDSWLNRYLGSCSIRDFSNTLEHLNACIMKIMIVSTHQNTDKMHEALSSNVFSCVKHSFVNGSAVLQVAEFAFHFTKMIFADKEIARFYGDFDELAGYFIASESANVNVVRAFTMFCLRDGQLFSYFDSHKKLQSLVIQSWIRCSVLCDQNHVQDNLDLTMMIAQLNEYRQIQSSLCMEDTPQEHVCKFISAFGKYWKAITNFQDRCRVRERADVYYKSIDKYVSPNLKQPTTYEATMQIISTIATLIFHCSPIIYSRAKPSCVLHSVISNVFLPPQIFIDSKRIHTYVVNSICKCWYMMMYGLYQLDYKNDIYIDKTMKDMITQYLPYFAVKTLSNKEIYDVSYRMIPSETSGDLSLEKYILEKISLIFFGCHGKQIHPNAMKVLAVVYQTLRNSIDNSSLVELFISTVFPSVFEQFIFTDANSVNKRTSGQIISLIFTNEQLLSNNKNLKQCCITTIVDVFSKYLAFSSNIVFKAFCIQSSSIKPILKEAIPQIENIITNIEKLRGVGYDAGLRNGLRELMTASR